MIMCSAFTNHQGAADHQVLYSDGVFFFANKGQLQLQGKPIK